MPNVNRFPNPNKDKNYLQSILFNKNKFKNIKQVKKWLIANDYYYDGLDNNDNWNWIRARQIMLDDSHYYYATNTNNKNIHYVYGYIKKK